MVVLVMVMSLIIGHVDRIFQSFLSGCVFFPAIVFNTLPIGDNFPSQMLAEPAVSYRAQIGPSSDRIIILPVRSDVRVGRGWVVGVLVVDPFEFCSIYFLDNLQQ